MNTYYKVLLKMFYLRKLGDHGGKIASDF